MASRNGSGNAACCGAQAVRLQHKVRDPLCGAPVDVNGPWRLEHEGRSHRFCSEDCREAYARAMAGEAVPGVAFACAMHPEARQDVPGPCAICGVALAPVREAPLPEQGVGKSGSLLGRLRAALHV